MITFIPVLQIKLHFMHDLYLSIERFLVGIHSHEASALALHVEVASVQLALILAKSAN